MQKPNAITYGQGYLAKFKADVLRYERFLNSKRKKKIVVSIKKINWLKYGLVTF